MGSCESRIDDQRYIVLCGQLPQARKIRGFEKRICRSLRNNPGDAVAVFVQKLFEPVEIEDVGKIDAISGREFRQNFDRVEIEPAELDPDLASFFLFDRVEFAE